MLLLPPSPALPRGALRHGVARRGALPRRGLLTAGAGLLALAALPGGGLDLAEEWQGFRRRFLAPEGRILDDGQGGISHSEGQGYGLLIALAAGDRAAFERIAGWTATALRRPQDALHAWRHAPGQPPDANNASDGDLLIAWALLQGAERWRLPELRRRAASIAADLLRLCTLEVEGRLLLLPGAQGFTDRERVVINPSYYVFPALQALAGLGPAAPWRRLAQDGAALLRQAQFGRWHLPADWFEIPRSGGRPSLSRAHLPRFSYDALRVPLHLAWGGLRQEPALRAAADFWYDPANPYRPAWADLRTDSIAPYAATPGIQAVARLAARSASGQASTLRPPRPSEAEGYYGAVLCFLCHLAEQEATAPLLG
ncbi:glycosyl hydrolase family 8 [Pseudoroseomonas cervicalis]|uniref:glycosyl hydrolase family 8 n=1 Tax=Teichococcus cervicalis TaxID=204525 RepID=UPI00278114F8|nr:glycosyl hydrolase family 8 [Pseudoroseomonas cervicalis]MDQ1079464.1 endo-1,4-beta-D-glucanase Y [Pseudoroseomonas cervicalis]